MAFAFVQADAAGSSAGSSVSVTLSSAVGSGNTVLGTVSWGSTTLTNLTSVTDDKGNSYTIKDKVADATNVQSAAFFVLGNITNAPKTLTANFSGTLNFLEVGAAEYSGAAAAADPSDGHIVSAVTAIGIGGGTASSGSLTTTVNGDLLVGLTVDTNNGAAPTAGSGFTVDLSSATVQVTTAIEHETQTTAGATSATFTSPSGGRYIVSLIAIKPAGAAFLAARNAPMLQAVKRAAYW